MRCSEPLFHLKTSIPNPDQFTSYISRPSTCKQTVLSRSTSSYCIKIPHSGGRPLRLYHSRGTHQRQNFRTPKVFNLFTFFSVQSGGPFDLKDASFLYQFNSAYFNHCNISQTFAGPFLAWHPCVITNGRVLHS